MTAATKTKKVNFYILFNKKIQNMIIINYEKTKFF